MGASRIMNLQRHRIAQCRSVVIRILGNEGVPVQVDGEAWVHPPGIIRIMHKNRVQLICRDRVSLKTTAFVPLSFYLCYYYLLPFSPTDDGTAGPGRFQLSGLVPGTRTPGTAAPGRGGDAPAEIAGWRQPTAPTLPAPAAPRPRRAGGEGSGVARQHPAR